MAVPDKMEQHNAQSSCSARRLPPLGGDPNICSLLDVGWDLLESEPLISIKAI